MSVERPRLRSYIEPLPVQVPDLPEEAGPLFALRDPFKLTGGTTVIPAAGLAFISLFDGTRTIEEAQAEFAATYGVAPPTDQVEALLAQLRQALLLEGPHLTRFVEEFTAATVRPAACLGSYPGEPDELKAFLEAQYVREGGPGQPPGEASGAAPIRGVVSPHIDMHRGGHSYAWAWRAVAESCPASLFVVFGTSHTGTRPVVGAGPGASEPRYALTRKTFQTPAGDLPVDAEVFERLLAAYDGPDDLLAGEFHHRGEHSVEFQAVYLAHLFAGRRDVRILPILCGGLRDLVGAPGDDERLDAFHRALAEALAPLPPDEVAFVAGIDLAHVGAQFHEPPVSEDDLGPVQAADRETLRLAVEERCPAAVHDDIRRDDNARNICGHAALVGFLEALRRTGAPLEGELLHYDRWHDGESAVSFASAVYRAQSDEDA